MTEASKKNIQKCMLNSCRLAWRLLKYEWDEYPSRPEVEKEQSFVCWLGTRGLDYNSVLICHMSCDSSDYKMFCIFLIIENYIFNVQSLFIREKKMVWLNIYLLCKRSPMYLRHCSLISTKELDILRLSKYPKELDIQAWTL